MGFHYRNFRYGSLLSSHDDEPSYALIRLGEFDTREIESESLADRNSQASAEEI